MKKKVAILGSTGSIGKTTVDIIKNDKKNFEILLLTTNDNLNELTKQIRELKPKIVLFGQSVFLFPTPLKELAEAAHEVGSTVIYDGAHVLGLIAGGCFQDPLHEGADVMTGSSHKTFPGPHDEVPESL